MKPLIYITGASGFLGKHLVNALSGTFELVTIPHQLIKSFNLKPFHTFFFLSSYGNHYQQKDLELTYKANVDDLFNTLLKLKGLEFKNFIHLSSSSVTIDTTTAYSATKHAGEILVSQMARELNKRIFSVRPYSLFGEGEAEFRFIPMMVHKLSTGEVPILVPEPVHDWVYVGDFVDALLHLMHQPERVDKPIEVGYGEPKTNLGVFNDICLLLGANPTYKNISSLRAYDNLDWYKKEQDALELTGWRPIYGYKEGLKRTVKYYAE